MRTRFSTPPTVVMPDSVTSTSVKPVTFSPNATVKLSREAPPELTCFPVIAGSGAVRSDLIESVPDAVLARPSGVSATPSAIPMLKVPSAVGTRSNV